MSWLGYWGNDEEEIKVRKFIWSPKPDITTYELALCVTMLIPTNAEILQRAFMTPYQRMRSDT